MFIFDDYTEPYLIIIIGSFMFGYIFTNTLLNLKNAINKKEKASIVPILVFFLISISLSYIAVQYGNEELNKVKTRLEESSKTLTIKTIEFQVTGSGFTKDFIIVNDKYKINTDIALPKGTTITIQKHKSEPYYRLVKYKIK